MYFNNSGEIGGIYYIVGYTDVKSEISIKNSEFTSNFGAVGGVLAIYNLV